MNSLINAFVAFANGLYNLTHHLASPGTAAVVIIAASLAWLACIEIDELNRRGTKPTVETH